MIFRRRHTANFTTIGNALFEDERLAADEVGILAYLLSRPDNWEVRRPALMRRWHIGRDAMKRIMTNWMRTGWCCAKKTRLDNGTFFIVYEIRDEHGPDLTDGEIRDALSLVSSEAVEGESKGEDGADHLRETSDPPTPKPGVVDQPVATRMRPIEDSLNPDSLKTESTKAMRAFTDVKVKWRPDHIVSSHAAEVAFVSLNPTDNEDCYRGIVPYLADCDAQKRKVCDLTTFIRERRWERFKELPAKTGQHHAMPHTPQWHRWRDYYSATNPSVAKFMEVRASQGEGFTVPSEWPPRLPKTESSSIPADA